MLAKKTPNIFLFQVAGILSNLANIYKAKRNFALTVTFYEKSLNGYKSIVKKNPNYYLPYIVMPLSNLASCYLYFQPNKEKSIALAKEILEIAEKFPQVPRVQGYANKARQVLQIWKEM